MFVEVTPTLLTHVGKTTSTTKVACFDLDWTLIRPIKSRFFADSYDFSFLPNRICGLKAIQEDYTIVIFTNQKFKGKRLHTALERINNVIASFQVQEIFPWVFVSTGEDEFRKPNTGMWLVFSQYFPDLSEKLFIGDAAGRPGDYDNSDLLFSQNAGLTFYTPEEIFPRNTLPKIEHQTVFVFVGMPGSGKSTFYEKELKPLGVVHVNQDTLKTRQKIMKKISQELSSGKSIAIDSTNPTPQKRREFIELAKEFGVSVIILYFVRNGYNFNKLREKPVPDIVYNVYFKNLVEPTEEIDGVPVIEIF